MARKRVNKNLVAFLTIMGILLTVVVVAIATGLGASKDPEVWADQARQRDELGDYETAMRLFDRAYRASKDVSYLAEAAACAYRYGEIGTALGTLQRAYNEQRSNPHTPAFRKVVTTYLDHIWEIFEPQAYWRIGPDLRERILEYALALEEVDDQDVRGPVSEAVARLAMAAEDPDSEQAGEEALQRAIELDENHPWVVLTRIQRQRRLANQRFRELRDQDATEAELNAAAEEFRSEIMRLLEAGLAANPGEWRLLAAYVGELQGQERFDEARAALERALEENPDDPDIHAGLAAFLLSEAGRQRPTCTEAEYTALLDQAADEARQAIELAPAYYGAYVTLAQTELARGLEGDVEAAKKRVRIDPQRYEAALEIYDNAILDTVSVRSVYAALGERVQRPLLHIRAFNTAMEYYLQERGQAGEEQARRWVERFLEHAESRYPEQAFTYYMRGQKAIMDDDRVQAIRHFEQAEQLAQADRTGFYPALWFQAFGGVLPVHRLALLYREQNQPGEALKYTQTAIEAYLRYQPDKPPPISLALNRLELMDLLGNAPEQTLDVLAEVRRLYADELARSEREQERLRLAAIEANALLKLNRSEEGLQALQAAGSEDVRALLLQANLAAQDGDTQTAEELIRQALEREDLTPMLANNALNMLVPILVEREATEEGKQILERLRQRFSDSAILERRLDQYEIVLTYRDPAERDAKLLEAIAQEPDPIERQRRYFDYYIDHGEFEKAAEYLDQLEQKLPDDQGVLENQFLLALRDKDYERAEEYVVKLSRLHEGQGADDAGGATYRARLALARGDAEEAVRQYRAARERLPRSSQLQVQLARALLAANRVDEAVDALLEAVEINPRDFQANVLLDDTFLRLVPPEQRPQDWEKYLEQAARLRPQHPYILEQAERLDPQAGIARREELRAAEPDNVDNLIRLAQLYASPKVGDEARATECFQEAARLDPGNDRLARSAAFFFAQAGRRAEGEQLLQAYLDSKKGKDRGFAYALLANFYKRLGDVEAAEQAYEQARRVIEEQVSDSQERRQALLAVELDLVRFYDSLDGRENETIAACHWVLDKLDPEQPQDVPRIQYVRRTIMSALLRLGRLEEAEKEIVAYQQDFPDDTGALVYLAQLKLMQREWETAYEALSQVLQAAPDHIWSLVRRGTLAIRLGRYTQARDDLVRARELAGGALDRLPEATRMQGPEAMEYLNICSSLASVYEITQNYELAEGQLLELLQLVTDHPGLGMTQQQVAKRLLRLYSRAKRQDKAQQIVSEFMARYPDAHEWALEFGALYAAQGREYLGQARLAEADGNAAQEREYRDKGAEQFALAAGYYERAARLAKAANSPLWLTYTAYQLDALAASNQSQRAIEIFSQLQQQLSEIPAIIYAAMIRVYQTAGDSQRALATLDLALIRALAEGPGTLKGVIGFSAEHLPGEARINALQKLLDRTPPESKGAEFLRIVLATQLVSEQRDAEALKTLEPVLAKQGADVDIRLTAMNIRAQALYQSGDLDGALDIFRNVLRSAPDNLVALNSLAFLLADETDRVEEAVPYAERAREIGDRDPNVLDTVGWVYFKNGRFEEAEAAFKQALSLDPNNMAVHYHLGVMYADRGRLAEARRMLLRARELRIRQGLDKYREEIEAELQRLP